MKVNQSGTQGPDFTEVASTQKTQIEKAKVSHNRLDQTLGEDTATLSGDSASVTNLTTQALQSSDIREDKVAALRQAIQNGAYKIDPAKIADAIIQDSES